MNLKDTAPELVDNALFESYVDGLRDSGCRLDRQMVRFGYTTSAALRVGLFQLIMLNEEFKQNGTDVAPGSERPVTADCFEVVRAKEAYELLEAI